MPGDDAPGADKLPILSEFVVVEKVAVSAEDEPAQHNELVCAAVDGVDVFRGGILCGGGGEDGEEKDKEILHAVSVFL